MYSRIIVSIAFRICGNQLTADIGCLVVKDIPEEMITRDASDSPFKQRQREKQSAITSRSILDNISLACQ